MIGYGYEQFLLNLQIIFKNENIKCSALDVFMQ